MRQHSNWRSDWFRRALIVSWTTLSIEARAQTTWSTHSTGSNQLLEGAAFGAGRYVAVGGGGTIVSSADGENWSSEDSGVSTSLRGLTFGGGQFIATGETGTILTSSDGQTWAAATPPPSVATKFFAGVAHGNTTYVSVGGTGSIIHSSDAITWSEATSVPYSFFQQAVAHGNGKFVSVGAFGTIMNSSDGNVWNAAPSGLPFQSSSNLFGVTWSGAEFVAVGALGRILTSPDGITWTQEVSGATSALRGVTFASGLYVATGADGTILLSEDSEAWHAQTSDVVETLFKPMFGAGRFVVVGGRQSIFDPGVASRIISSTETWDNGFRWVAAGYSGAEDSGGIDLEIERLGRDDVVSEVSWAALSGTATASDDFQEVSGTITFDIGERIKTVTAPLIDDSESEGDESFLAFLTPVTAGWILHEPSEAPCTIIDDEDTDSDGLGDDWEVANFGDITTSDGTADSDSDGHNDLREFQDGSDPKDDQSLFYRLALTATSGGTIGTSPSGSLFSPSAPVSITAQPESGFEFLGWTGHLSSPSTTIMVTMTSDVTLAAQFGVTLEESLDQPGVAWGGGSFGYPWLGQSAFSFDGQDCAWVEGDLLPNGEIADLETSIFGPAVVSFQWKVSSSQGTDFLRFEIDGTELAAISGEVGWVQETHTLEPGLHFLTWSYERSFSAPSGLNAAWVDQFQISIPFATWQSQQFSAGELLDPLVSGEHADPDLDGLTNFEEYAFDLDPRAHSETARLPRAERFPLGSGATIPAFVYDRPVFRMHDVTYEPQVSDSPAGPWSPLAGLEEIDPAVNGYQTIRLPDHSGLKRQFYRLWFSN